MGSALAALFAAKADPKIVIHFHLKSQSIRACRACLLSIPDFV